MCAIRGGYMQKDILVPGVLVLANIKRFILEDVVIILDVTQYSWKILHQFLCAPTVVAFACKLVFTFSSCLSPPHTTLLLSLLIGWKPKLPTS